MAGVRLRHVTARNARFTIVDRDIVFDTPYQCSPPEFGGCGVIHVFKTHHLNIDDTGTAIVGDVLFDRVHHLLTAAGFEVMEEVKKPPALGVGMGPMIAGRGAWGNIPIIRGEGDDG